MNVSVNGHGLCKNREEDLSFFLSLPSSVERLSTGLSRTIDCYSSSTTSLPTNGRWKLYKKRLGSYMTRCSKIGQYLCPNFRFGIRILRAGSESGCLGTSPEDRPLIGRELWRALRWFLIWRRVRCALH